MGGAYAESPGRGEPIDKARWFFKRLDDLPDRDSQFTRLVETATVLISKDKKIATFHIDPSCLLKGCVQRVRIRPDEQGGRSNDRLDTCQ